MLIKVDLPRGNWRIGKITEIMTCSAKVILTSKRIISRPLILLYPIEYSDGNHDVFGVNAPIQELDNGTETVRQIPKSRGSTESYKTNENKLINFVGSVLDTPRFCDYTFFIHRTNEFHILFIFLKRTLLLSNDIDDVNVSWR